MSVAALEITTAIAALPPMLTVYSKPNCVQCDATYRSIASLKLVENVDYVSIDITEDAEAYAYVASLGYLQAPVVVFGDKSWSGFRPDQIKEAAQVIHASSVRAEDAAA